MPLRWVSKLHLWITILITLSIVTIGACVSTGQQTIQHETLNKDEAVIGMGPKSISELVGNESPERTTEIPQASITQLDLQQDGDSLENRISSRPSEDTELKNPHPHLTIPSLPFCKPTKTTVRSSMSEESKKSGEEDDKGIDESEDDVEVVQAPDSLVENDRQFLVATLDGKVTLLNRTGHQIWSVKTGPLFSSTISSLQLNEDGKWINLIPSLTGGVYKYDGDSLYPMPFNADSLLKKSFKISNDVVITGGKELRTFGIDVNSGNVRYECGISGCIMPGAAELNPSGKGPEDSPILVVKKQMQTVRAIDSSTGVERWNFSVGTHELALAGVTEGCYHGAQKDSGYYNHMLKIVIPEGRVFGADRENRVAWSQDFESPISQAWILEDGQLISVDPITNTPLTDVPSLYIGIHNQQFYVQESQNTADKMERYFGLEGLGLNSMKRPPLNLAWKPPAAIEGVSGSTALSTIAPAPNWVTFAPTPNFKPIFVYDKDYTGDPILETPNNTEHDDEDDSDEDVDEEPHNIDFSEGITQVIVMSLWYWWKEVLGISLLTAVLLNLILMKPIMRAVRSHTIVEMTDYFQNLWNRRKDEEETRALLARHSSNLLSLPAPNEEPIDEEGLVERRKRSTSCSSTGSMNSPCITIVEAQFSSQYLKEFIPIECLGRGGFGVVFEAKKVIDERTYAVKRITLPDREKARVRVMREVKALAQLDHKNIVRYFNAWIESPPPGWLEKNDPLWARTIIGSMSPTMDYPSDMFGSSIVSEHSRRRKPDHSKISVPATPSDGPVDDDDSYIVFETSATTTTAMKSPDSFTTLRPSKIVFPDKNLTSIPIPTSAETSATSSVSSASGGGFFARRPNSLNLRSSLSSFQEDDALLSQHQSVSISHRGDVTDKPVEKSDEDVEASQGLMYLYIQQELCQKRTLQDWLRLEKCRDLKLVISLFSQIVEAVEYVHSKKLIHRDLKPSNIFLADVTENGLGLLTVKIGDFGLATTAYAEVDADKIATATTPVDDRSVSASPGQHVRINLTGHVGTHLYMSPEQYHRKPYDYKVDIYSLGLIFFELLVPFSTDMERYNILSGVRKMSFPDNFKTSYSFEYDLIRTMISHNPNERPDAAKINSWVKSHITTLPNDSDASPQGQDFFGGRSVSSPGEIVVFEEDRSASRKKEKQRFFKTQSVM